MSQCIPEMRERLQCMPEYRLGIFEHDNEKPDTHAPCAQNESLVQRLLRLAIEGMQVIDVDRQVEHLACADRSVGL